MADNFGLINADTMTIPAMSGVAVTKHDTTEISVTRGLYVGTGGDVAVKMRNDSTAVTFKNVADGSLLPLRVKLVLSTGTTASDIVALY
jgi:hypothetical protein